MSDAEDREHGQECGDREDEESEEESDEEDDLTRMTKLASKQMMKVFSGRSATDEDVDEFFKEHHKVLTQEAAGHGTFLHKIVQLVYDKDIKAVDVKPLIIRLMEVSSDMIRTKNEDKRNPLYHAIHLKKYTWRLVDYMLRSCPDARAIADALEMRCGDERSSKTCLTLAFEKGLKEDVLKSLISHASYKALELRDVSGKTPFHYAVQYGQCSDERVGVIKLLLEKDNDAVKQHKAPGTSQPLETFLDSKYERMEDGIKYSVYSEHKRTAKVYQQHIEESLKVEKEARLREAEQDREVKVANIAVSMREREPLMPGLDKVFKSRAAEDRDYKARKLDRDRDSSRKEHQNADEVEIWRQELRDQEREALERKLKDEKKYLKGPKELTKLFRDPKVALSGSEIATLKAASEHAPNTPLKRVATQSFDTNIDDEKTRKSRTTSTRKSSTKGPDPKVLAKNSIKILTLLKLHYMRTRSIRMATSFLHGKNSEHNIQICFDYKGLPSEIEETVFNERFGKGPDDVMRFEDVLMFVRFPSVSVKRQKGRNAPKLSEYCRQDMEFFFNWLYTKGVRRILKVEVEESNIKPHSDESIQKSLEKIVVEHLDWQKMDLDPRLICQLARKANHPSYEDEDGDGTNGPSNELREVTLRWSGNNAVLRGWSEPEGLPLLKRLRAVNINYPPQSDLIDRNGWVASNLEEFRSRLNRNLNIDTNTNNKIEILPSKDVDAAETSSQLGYDAKATEAVLQRTVEMRPRQGKNGSEVPVSMTGVPKESGRVNPMTEHEWLNCMTGFAKHMNLLWGRTIKDAQSLPSQDPIGGNQLSGMNQQTKNDLESLQKPVVVALIDDGVDICDPAFAGRAIEGVTFDYQDSATMGQYYISGKGHGTEMARMICKVCPMANIYSIRLKTHSSPDKGGLTIDAVSAAQAIEAALDKGAAIISMSWTIPVPSEGSEEKKTLDSVLERACKQKVLMFCSSSDQISDTDHYPSSFRRHRFFLIGAAHDDGSAYGHAGKNNDFIFPGVNVNTSGGQRLHLYLADKTAVSEESTGSSIATALAAGLAAMITYCFKASALAAVIVGIRQVRDYTIRPQLVKKADVDRIAEHDVLKGAFNRIGRLENGQFIQVWDRFQPATEHLKDDLKSDEDKLECIMKLCSNLIER
ncbi:hypothetical protein FGRMN_5906 [Fusarium graminum]|nr:hypothetical protein FGRMN_5906 [Fusarium graminum]